jgi:hypothetical protein
MQILRNASSRDILGAAEKNYKFRIFPNGTD